VKAERGTARPHRDKFTVEITVPQSPPQQPDWLLTKGGAQVWLDLVPRATQVGATELDSTTLALYCNLLSNIAMCEATGNSPPISAIAIALRYADALGLSGIKSRVVKGIDPTLRAVSASNPFHKFVKREPADRDDRGK
jgi:phage terminase small subunit